MECDYHIARHIERRQERTEGLLQQRSLGHYVVKLFERCCKLRTCASIDVPGLPGYGLGSLIALYSLHTTPMSWPREAGACPPWGRDTRQAGNSARADVYDVGDADTPYRLDGIFGYSGVTCVIEGTDGEFSKQRCR